MRCRAFTPEKDGRMLYKIEATKLRAGMYVVDTGCSWLQHPYLYSVTGELTEWELGALLRKGYTEAFIDLVQCRQGSLPPELQTLAQLHIHATAEGPRLPPQRPQTAIEEELPRAKAVLRASFGMAKTLMDNARAGKSFNPQRAEPLVEKILDSLDRNANALFGLCKLRQTDEYTYSHSVNVSVFAGMLARGLGLDRDTVRAMALGGLLHDVGKAMIPLRILTAPRRLTNAEMAVMKRHPLLGHAYLQDFRTAPAEVFQAIMEHHEQICGLGYPFGLPAEDISLCGRVTAIVDVFDALTSKRVYRDSMPLHKALSIIYGMCGKELFTLAAERFIHLLGVYPMGSVVELGDGSIAVVAETGGGPAAAPAVVLVRDKNGKKLDNIHCELAESGSPAIMRLVSAQKHGVDPAATLGIAV